MTGAAAPRAAAAHSPAQRWSAGSSEPRPFLGRVDHLGRVGSTNDVVRAWLADGAAEVCLAIADEQTAGRGRSGRTWQAPAGSGVLLSLGFRPTWLAPERTWRLAAIVALAMADAAAEAAALPPHAVLLKWPNDLVVEDGGPLDLRAGTLRKLGGVLGETDGLGTADPRAIVGIGLNAGWPKAVFPPDLAPSMTSLDELSAGRPIDRDELVDRFIARLAPMVESLRAGSFDGVAWATRQVTSGREVRLETADGVEVAEALGVDPASGALVVADPTAIGGTRSVLSGEVVHVRLPGAPGEPARASRV